MIGSMRPSTIERLDWPVLTLEYRRHRLRRRLGLGIFALLLPPALFAVLQGSLGGTEVGMLSAGLCWLLSLAVLIVVTVHSTRSVVNERERGSLDLLVLTPLSSREIVDQKVAAVLLRVAPLLLLGVGAGAAMVASRAIPLWAAGMGVVLVPLGAVGLSYLGVWLSCICRQAVTAMLVIFGAHFVLGGLVPVVVVLGSPLFRLRAIRAFDRLRTAR